MIAGRMAAWRAAAGAAASRVYPGLDARLWNRQRDRLIRAAAPLPPVTPRSADGPRLVAIATGEGPDAPTWQPAAGNHFYEIARTAADLMGADRVLILRAGADEPPDAWHARMIAAIADFGATHVIANVEIDPYDHEEWTWDLFQSRLRASWPGVLLGLMYDSAYEWTAIRAQRLVRRDRRTLMVALDRSMAGILPPPLAHVGPVILPMCRDTQASLLEATTGLPKDVDLSFIGALYPYRVPVIDDLAEHGIPVTVNPQRPDATRTYEESRANQPDYRAYMSGLARSEITLNFSRANMVDVQQLKTRLLEASFVGCLVATDDADLSDRYFTEGQDFVRFRSVPDAADVVRPLLADRERLRRMQQAARLRARDIAETVFWERVDAGLATSGLPTVARREDL